MSTEEYNFIKSGEKRKDYPTPKNINVDDLDYSSIKDDKSFDFDEIMNTKNENFEESFLNVLVKLKKENMINITSPKKEMMDKDLKEYKELLLKGENNTDKLIDYFLNKKEDSFGNSLEDSKNYIKEFINIYNEKEKTNKFDIFTGNKQTDMESRKKMLQYINMKPVTKEERMEKLGIVNVKKNFGYKSSNKNEVFNVSLLEKEQQVANKNIKVAREIYKDKVILKLNSKKMGTNLLDGNENKIPINLAKQISNKKVNKNARSKQKVPNEQKQKQPNEAILTNLSNKDISYRTEISLYSKNQISISEDLDLEIVPKNTCKDDMFINKKLDSFEPLKRKSSYEIKIDKRRFERLLKYKKPITKKKVKSIKVASTNFYYPKNYSEYKKMKKNRSFSNKQSKNNSSNNLQDNIINSIIKKQEKSKSKNIITNLNNTKTTTTIISINLTDIIIKNNPKKQKNRAASAKKKDYNFVDVYYKLHIMKNDGVEKIKHKDRKVNSTFGYKSSKKSNSVQKKLFRSTSKFKNIRSRLFDYVKIDNYNNSYSKYSSKKISNIIKTKSSTFGYSKSAYKYSQVKSKFLNVFKIDRSRTPVFSPVNRLKSPFKTEESYRNKSNSTLTFYKLKKTNLLTHNYHGRQISLPSYRKTRISSNSLDYKNYYDSLYKVKSRYQEINSPSFSSIGTSIKQTEKSSYRFNKSNINQQHKKHTIETKEYKVGGKIINNDVIHDKIFLNLKSEINKQYKEHRVKKEDEISKKN